MKPFATRRAGLSLVELLVVITILTIITAATIPIMAPGIDGRRQREAARLVSTAFSAAQTRAVANGRPAGVWIERDLAARYASSVLYNCEVPPPYTGDSTDTRVVIERIPTPPRMDDDTTGAAARYNVSPQMAALNSQYLYFRAILVSGSFSDGMIQPGDRIQFNNQGQSYEIFHGLDANNDGYIDGAPAAAIPPSGPLPVLPGFILRIPKRFKDTNSHLDPAMTIPNPNYERHEPYVDGEEYQRYHDQYKARYLPWPNARLGQPPNPRDGGRSFPMPFRIERQPQKSVDSPVRLPEGAVIDLRWSGIGDNFGGNSIDPSLPADPPAQKIWPINTPVLVMFSPQGDLESIAALGSRPELAVSSLHLLVGKRERILDDNYLITSPTDAPRDPMPFPLPSVEDEQLNFQDMENFWVTVQKGNGIATTSQVASVVDPPTTTSPVQPWGYYQFWINSTRRFARTSRTEGGQ